MTDKWSVEDFLSQYNSINTLSVYRSTLRGFFKLFYPELQKLSKKELDNELVEVSLQYIQQDKDFRKDLMHFRKHISQLAPKTIATKLAVLIRYFESNEITLNIFAWLHGLQLFFHGLRSFTFLTRGLPPFHQYLDD